MARAVNFVAAAIAALALVCAVSADSALATCGDQASTVSLSLASSCSSTQVFTFQGQKTFTYREVCLVWPKCCPAGDGCSAGECARSQRPSRCERFVSGGVAAASRVVALGSLFQKTISLTRCVRWARMRRLHLLQLEEPI